MEKKKKPNWALRILFFLFLIYISLTIAIQSGYYEAKLNEIVNNSVRQTLFRSILTTLTTIVPVICLMLFGAFEIINFNIALGVGFIAGLYSSVVISNQLWLLLEKRRLRKPKKIEKKTDEVEELQIKGINC